MTRRGFSLIELVVSMAIGTFLVAAAVAFGRDHTRALGFTFNRVEIHQTARQAVDLLAYDARQSGLGVGYRPDGGFGGVLLGDYTFGAGAAFRSNDQSIALMAGTMITDDVGLRFATGNTRTIAHYTTGFGQVCAGGGFKVGDRVVLQSREGFHSQVVTLANVASASCLDGTCVKGCSALAFDDHSAWVSDDEARTVNYVDGELTGKFDQVVYFVTPNAEGRGELRRTGLGDTTPCVARDSTCGGLIAEGVETLQMAVYQWDPEAKVWSDQTAAASISDRRRIRLDFEMVMAGKDEKDLGKQGEQVALDLAPGVCVPGPDCGARPIDRAPRYVVRTSVEVKNSGRQRIE